MVIRCEKLAAIAVCVLLTNAAFAQTSPSPGPTKPPATLPVPEPGDKIVINPTIVECRQGWRPGLKWTKEQFDKFCAQYRLSK